MANPFERTWISTRPDRGTRPRPGESAEYHRARIAGNRSRPGTPPIDRSAAAGALPLIRASHAPYPRRRLPRPRNPVHTLTPCAIWCLTAYGPVRGRRVQRSCAFRARMRGTAAPIRSRQVVAASVAARSRERGTQVRRSTPAAPHVGGRSRTSRQRACELHACIPNLGPLRSGPPAGSSCRAREASPGYPAQRTSPRSPGQSPRDGGMRAHRWIPAHPRSSTTPRRQPPSRLREAFRRPAPPGARALHPSADRAARRAIEVRR